MKKGEHAIKMYWHQQYYIKIVSSAKLTSFNRFNIEYGYIAENISTTIISMTWFIIQIHITRQDPYYKAVAKQMNKNEMNGYTKIVIHIYKQNQKNEIGWLNRIC